MRICEVECIECNGTGSSVPDCQLCEGYRSVKVKRAYAKGWKKRDLPNIEEDGYCECPQCFDDATTCMFCHGDGTTDPDVENQQPMRVLIAAKHNFIPLIFRHDYRGFIIRDQEMYLLSNRAAGALRNEGLINWYCSVFGDEIYLTPKGEEAAKKAWKEYRAFCRRWIASERTKRALIATYQSIATVAAQEAGKP